MLIDLNPLPTKLSCRLPVSPDVINTTFTLFTREQKNGEPLEYQNITTITSSKISNERPIKIIIHGFGSSGRRPWVVQMTEALIYIVSFKFFFFRTMVE